MAGLYNTFTVSHAMQAHAALVEGISVTVSATAGAQGVPVTALPAAGGTIAGVIVNNDATAAGMLTSAVWQMGEVVPVRTGAAVANGAELSVDAAGKGITAATGAMVHYIALQSAAAKDTLISCIRIGSHIKA